MDGQTDGRMDGPTDQWIDKKWPIESRVRSLNVRGLKICNIIEGGIFFFFMIFELLFIYTK